MDRNRIERLRYRSWHRGTREMDLLMGSFADRYLEGLSSVFLDQYEEILETNDPDLDNWITGVEPLPPERRSDIMGLLCRHSYVKKSD